MIKRVAKFQVDIVFKMSSSMPINIDRLIFIVLIDSLYQFRSPLGLGGLC